MCPSREENGFESHTVHKSPLDILDTVFYIVEKVKLSSSSAEQCIRSVIQRQINII